MLRRAVVRSAGVLETVGRLLTNDVLGTMALSFLVSSCGTVTARNGDQQLVASLIAAAQQSNDAGIKATVPLFIQQLDSLRILNLEAVLTQRRKRDWYLAGALGFSAGSAVIAATSMNDGDKATWTGVFAAVGGLLTALNAKFRHDEDAAVSETCASLAEAELLAFQIPADLNAFNAWRKDFSARWQGASCGGGQSRLGVWPNKKGQTQTK